jgi:hypothetical protein
MLPRWILCIPALLMSLVLGSCGGLSRAPAPELVQQRQVVGGLTIVFDHPEEVRVNQQQKLLATITDAQGRPVDDASVYFDLVMPAHPMGVNQPIAIANGNGVYESGGVYTMDGDWLITVVATIEDQTSKATFTIPVLP